MEWKETGQRADLRLDTLEYLQLIRAGHNKLRKLPERLGELKVVHPCPRPRGLAPMLLDVGRGVESCAMYLNTLCICA